MVRAVGAMFVTLLVNIHESCFGETPVPTTNTPTNLATYNIASLFTMFTACPDNWPVDGECDVLCFNSACNYDDADCPTFEPTNLASTSSPTRRPTQRPTASSPSRRPTRNQRSSRHGNPRGNQHENQRRNPLHICKGVHLPDQQKKTGKVMHIYSPT